MTAREPRFRDGIFQHPCQAPGCTEEGAFGEGVRLGENRLGRWYCRAHVPPSFWGGRAQSLGASPPAPAPAHEDPAPPSPRSDDSGQGSLL